MEVPLLAFLKLEELSTHFFISIVIGGLIRVMWINKAALAPSMCREIKLNHLGNRYQTILYIKLKQFLQIHASPNTEAVRYRIPFYD